MLTVLVPLHTALLVRDFDRATQFYEAVLGLQRVPRSLKYNGAWYQIGHYQIHLIEDPTLLITHQHEAKWGRNPHVALGVADVEAAIATLGQAGYPVQRSASGRSACFTTDLDGNVIELTQVESNPREFET